MRQAQSSAVACTAAPLPKKRKGPMGETGQWREGEPERETPTRFVSCLAGPDLVQGGVDLCVWVVVVVVVVVVGVTQQMVFPQPDKKIDKVCSFRPQEAGKCRGQAKQILRPH